MDNKSIHMIDECGRVLLPAKLRGQIGLQASGSLTALVYVMDKYIVLFKRQDGELALDELGRICIPQTTLKQLQWGERDKLAVAVNVREGTIMLSMYEKYEG